MKNRKHRLQQFSKWGMTLLWIISMTGCQENTLYHVYQPVKSTGWDKGDTLHFVPPKSLSTTEGKSWQIGIRHKDSYPYQDIWLDIEGDTVHLMLTDKGGKWLGDGMGGIRQFYQEISLPASITGMDSIRQIKITHLMQHNPLPGICNIGIHIGKFP